MRGRGVAGAGELIVMSRLLILQSKRILLSSAETKLVERDHPDLRAHVDRLRRETSAAHERYREVVLKWAPTDSAQFCSVAVAGSAEAVQSLADKLRDISHGLPPDDQLEFAGDIACLEEIVGRWRKRILTSFGTAA